MSVRGQTSSPGVASRIMELGLQRDGAMEVPPGAYPVGWYDASPTPGQLGPAVLAGHVDWEGEPGAFYGLRELRAGDTVVVDRADGTVATFRVDRVERHAKDDFPTEEVYGDIDHAGLRLITCGGAFDEDAGDYQDNIIVFASFAAAGCPSRTSPPFRPGPDGGSDRSPGTAPEQHGRADQSTHGSRDEEPEAVVDQLPPVTEVTLRRAA